jgi:hypothetical protein
MDILSRPKISEWIYFVRQFADLTIKHGVQKAEIINATATENSKLLLYGFCNISTIREIEQNFIDEVNSIKIEVDQSNFTNVYKILIDEFKCIDNYKIWYKNNSLNYDFENEYYYYGAMYSCMLETKNKIMELSNSVDVAINNYFTLLTDIPINNADNLSIAKITFNFKSRIIEKENRVLELLEAKIIGKPIEENKINSKLYLQKLIGGMEYYSITEAEKTSEIINFYIGRFTVEILLKLYDYDLNINELLNGTRCNKELKQVVVNKFNESAQRQGLPLLYLIDNKTNYILPDLMHLSNQDVTQIVNDVNYLENTFDKKNKVDLLLWNIGIDKAMELWKNDCASVSKECEIRTGWNGIFDAINGRQKTIEEMKQLGWNEAQCSSYEYGQNDYKLYLKLKTYEAILLKYLTMQEKGIELNTNVVELKLSELNEAPTTIKEIIKDEIEGIEINKSWDYVFLNERNYNNFVELLGAYLSGYKYTIPNFKIELVSTRKTKFAKCLKRIYDRANPTTKPMHSDKKFYELLRFIKDYENDTDTHINKLMTRKD